MAKLMRLLEKMGLVYGQGQPESNAPVEGDTEPGGAAPVAGSAPGDGVAPAAPPAAVARLAPPRLDPALEAAAAEAASASAGAAEYPLEQIYSSAGIKGPEHGFTIDKLVEMMAADELKDLDDATRAKVITGMLRRLPGGPVSLGEIVRDAVQRDQALDAFERFLLDRVAKSERELGDANRALQAEIDQFVRDKTAMIQANQARVEAEKAKLERWRVRKLAEEERLFNAVQPFVDANPVTRGDPKGGPEAAPAV
jgi:hypothetical protein